MKQFSILSPVLGKREDVPSIFLQKAMTPEIGNCQFWNGKVRTSYGRTPEIGDASGTAVAVGDSQAVVKYLNHQSDTGSKYLLAFTALHAYRWNSTTYAWDAMHTCTATAVSWSANSFNGKVVATNNIDDPLVWDGGAETLFTSLSATLSTGVTIERAKVCTIFEGHVVFGNYDTSDGETYPNGIIISDLDDETLWNLSEAGDQSAYYVDGDGVVSGLGVKNDLMYVFKTRSARAFWYTGTASILNSRAYNTKVGTFSPESVGNDGDGNLYFFGSDYAFREVDIGRLSKAIEDSVRTINSEDGIVQQVRIAYIPEYDEVWWTAPVNSSETNNHIFCLQKNGIWYERSHVVSAFGVYESSTNYTWDNQPAGTWDDWIGIWNDSTEASGWLTDICSDYYGYTYRSHGSSGDVAWNGSAMVSTSPTYKFVMSTDLGNKGALRYFKRLLYAYAYFTSIGGEPVSIYIKEDNAADWSLAGTITTDGTTAIYIGELPLDYRARTFLIKIESSYPFEFLGAEFEYIDSGLR